MTEQQQQCYSCMDVQELKDILLVSVDLFLGVTNEAALVVCRF